jgi:hypothetical protein
MDGGYRVCVLGASGRTWRQRAGAAAISCEADVQVFMVRVQTSTFGFRTLRL